MSDVGIVVVTDSAIDVLKMVEESFELGMELNVSEEDVAVEMESDDDKNFADVVESVTNVLVLDAAIEIVDETSNEVVVLTPRLSWEIWAVENISLLTVGMSVGG